MVDGIRVDFRKWPDVRHWQFTMHPLGEDGYGTWLWAPPGTVFQRGDEPPRRAESLHVKLITNGAWWTAIWNREGPAELYVDIATPAKWGDSAVTMIDLDLDIVRRRNGQVEVLDEDEFLEHQATLGYPPDVVDRARTTTAALYLDVQRRRPPFDGTGQRWLETAAELDPPS